MLAAIRPVYVDQEPPTETENGRRLMSLHLGKRMLALPRNNLMSSNRRTMIEGYTAEELLGLPEERIDDFVLSDCPVTFVVGSARILGEFKKRNDSLVVELAHIDGGGEGVLPDALVCSASLRGEEPPSEGGMDCSRCALRES